MKDNILVKLKEFKQARTQLAIDNKDLLGRHIWNMEKFIFNPSTMTSLMNYFEMTNDALKIEAKIIKQEVNDNFIFIEKGMLSKFKDAIEIIKRGVISSSMDLIQQLSPIDGFNFNLKSVKCINDYHQFKLGLIHFEYAIRLMANISQLPQ